MASLHQSARAPAERTGSLNLSPYLTYISPISHIYLIYGLQSAQEVFRALP